MGFRSRMISFLMDRGIKIPAQGCRNTDLMRMICDNCNLQLDDTIKRRVQIDAFLKGGKSALRNSPAVELPVAAPKLPRLGPEFYDTKEWRALRYQALKINGGRCQCCGRQPPQVVLHVDHIKPRSKYPELELDISNLQVLCEDCNLGKSNKDETDWRISKYEQALTDIFRIAVSKYYRTPEAAVKAAAQGMWERRPQYAGLRLPDSGPISPTSELGKLRHEIRVAEKQLGIELSEANYERLKEAWRRHQEYVDQQIVQMNSHSEPPGQTGVGETAPVGQRTLN